MRKKEESVLRPILSFTVMSEITRRVENDDFSQLMDDITKDMSCDDMTFRRYAIKLISHLSIEVEQLRNDNQSLKEAIREIVREKENQ